MADPTTENRVTELEVEFKAMSKQLDSIATDMKQVLAFTSQLTLLNERQSRHNDDLDRAFVEIRKVQDYADLNLNKVRDDVKVIKHDTQLVREEAEGWINKGKGAWWAASILYALIQILIGGFLWFVMRDYQEIRKEVTTTSYEVKNHVEQSKQLKEIK